jgi:hypothetical protein
MSRGAGVEGGDGRNTDEGEGENDRGRSVRDRRDVGDFVGGAFAKKDGSPIKEWLG